MSTQSMAEVHALFRSGVDAIVSMTESYQPAEWTEPVCGEWTAEQTARHLLAVAGWYHQWLDRAIDGVVEPPFAAANINERNRIEIEQLADVSGADAIEQFRELAMSYLDRTSSHWETPFTYPFGRVTVGLHCGIAATEWHLHAWDLGNGPESGYEPTDAKGLFIAAGSCLAAARRGIGALLLRMSIPIIANRSPWKSMLRQTGRTMSTRKQIKAAGKRPARGK